MNIGWSDLGGYDAFFDAFEADKNNNLCDENVLTIDSHNDLIITEKIKNVVVIRLDNVIAIKKMAYLCYVKRVSPTK